jgi:hypothetical protein
MCVDIDSVRYNERLRAFAAFGDNAALAFFIASIARGIDPGGDILVAFGLLLGIAFLWMAWHIRGLIQSED